ncbi:hypothetical protein B0H19DRAFT_1253798 [Mycena capillaripes]|nr:hypothetical protein B0H19DRAFT_1253798 [Mycena capillaripes]
MRRRAHGGPPVHGVGYGSRIQVPKHGTAAPDAASITATAHKAARARLRSLPDPPAAALAMGARQEVGAPRFRRPRARFTPWTKARGGPILALPLDGAAAAARDRSL